MVTTELCRFVAYYHRVEAVDNGSNIHYYLKQNALYAVAYWVSPLFAPSSCCKQYI